MESSKDPNQLLDIFKFQRSKSKQKFCGDVWHLEEDKDGFFLILADGLGSGKDAHQAAQSAVDAILPLSKSNDLVNMLEEANHAVASLRGAAIAIIKADYATQTVQYIGLGNIRFFMIDEQGKMVYPLSKTGFLSGRKMQIRQQAFRYQLGSKFLIHSDGLVLKRIKYYLDSPLCVHKVGNIIEQSILDMPSDDVTFLLGQFPKM